MASIADILRRLVHASPADVVTHGEELAAIDAFEKQHEAQQPASQPEAPDSAPEPAPGQLPAGDAPPGGE